MKKLLKLLSFIILLWFWFSIVNAEYSLNLREKYQLNNFNSKLEIILSKKDDATKLRVRALLHQKVQSSNNERLTAYLKYIIDYFDKNILWNFAISNDFLESILKWDTNSWTNVQTNSWITVQTNTWAIWTWITELYRNNQLTNRSYNTYREYAVENCNRMIDAWWKNEVLLCKWNWEIIFDNSKNFTQSWSLQNTWSISNSWTLSNSWLTENYSPFSIKIDDESNQSVEYQWTNIYEWQWFDIVLDLWKNAETTIIVPIKIYTKNIYSTNNDDDILYSDMYKTYNLEKTDYWYSWSITILKGKRTWYLWLVFLVDCIKEWEVNFDIDLDFMWNNYKRSLKILDSDETNIKLKASYDNPYWIDLDETSKKVYIYSENKMIKHVFKWKINNVLVNTSACLNPTTYGWMAPWTSETIICDPKDPNATISSFQLEFKTDFWWTCNFN